ncbi:hypothetical protein, partial [Citrobacter rodentium]
VPPLFRPMLLINMGLFVFVLFVYTIWYAIAVWLSPAGLEKAGQLIPKLILSSVSKLQTAPLTCQKRPAKSMQ